MRTLVATACALLGFAANSVLCRLALAGRSIDAASFTVVRLCAGAVVLSAISTLSAARVSGVGQERSGASLGSALALFVYAGAFSLAYLRLEAGVGALLLFGLVQVTMLGAGLAKGERMRHRQWLGFVAAVVGLSVLTAPGLRAPDPLGAALMALSGVAWGVYSLRGRGVADPLRATGGNFLRAVPLGAAMWFTLLDGIHITGRGLVLAITSGAVASGLAYSLWYAALRELRATQAAILQLLVPVLAAAGGVAWLGEPITSRLLIAGTVILSGVALAVLPRAMNR